MCALYCCDPSIGRYVDHPAIPARAVSRNAFETIRQNRIDSPEEACLLSTILSQTCQLQTVVVKEKSQYELVNRDSLSCYAQNLLNRVYSDIQLGDHSNLCENGRATNSMFLALAAVPKS